MYSDSQQTLIATLPEELILDNILPRLPAKSLIRFKIVCKLWLSIISSIDFVKSHLKFSSLRPHFVVLIEEDDDNFMFLLPSDVNNNNVGELVRLDFDISWEFIAAELVGCCNGLLCFHLQHDTKDDFFCVWNPVTRQYRNIMIPSTEIRTLNYGFSEISTLSCGFSYASSIDDYKIVACFLGAEEYYHVFYFSLRLETWKRIVGFGIDDITYLSDSLFCPDKDLKCWKKDKCISGFDLVDEKWKEIPSMSWLSRYNWVDFFNIKQCVSLLCCRDDGFHVWVLKQFGDWNSWEKVFSLNSEGIHVCSMTESGKCLVKSAGQLKVVDASQGAPHESQMGIDISGEICGYGVYVDSLISPFIVCSEPNQD